MAVTAFKIKIVKFQKDLICLSINMKGYPAMLRKEPWNIPITIKENLLTYSRMFSEQTAPIGTYHFPMDSDLHGEGPCKIWAPGIDRVFSSMKYKCHF